MFDDDDDDEEQKRGRMEEVNDESEKRWALVSAVQGQVGRAYTKGKQPQVSGKGGEGVESGRTMLEPGYSSRERCDWNTVLKKCAAFEEPGRPAYSWTNQLMPLPTERSSIPLLAIKPGVRGVRFRSRPSHLHLRNPVWVR